MAHLDDLDEPELVLEEFVRIGLSLVAFLYWKIEPQYE